MSDWDGSKTGYEQVIIDLPRNISSGWNNQFKSRADGENKGGGGTEHQAAVADLPNITSSVSSSYDPKL